MHTILNRPFSCLDNRGHYSDCTQVIRSLAKRIYKTRNAIVHSKEGEQAKYIPFDHDNELAREMPILRFIAETVMMETSTIIE